jgi:superfamily II DNA or RNA helicase
MITLRPYQEDAVQAIRKNFAQGLRSLILCAPTGSGKTVTFSYIALETIKRGLSVMILCNRKELISQAEDKLNGLGIFPTLIIPGKRLTKNLCYLASVDTLRRREVPHVDLLIIDEAHIQVFDPQIARIGARFTIGATATPLRSGNQRCLSETYQAIIEPTKISDLLQDGYLVPAKTYGARQDFGKVGMKGGDFDANAIHQIFRSTQMFDGLLENFQKFGKGKAITFCANVAHSVETCEFFRANGVSAAHLDGTTPQAERRKILRDYKAGHIENLTNCGILTTGFDEPSIRTVIVNRDTLSLPLWLQMAGRGARLFDDKEHFALIDQGSNVYRHGFWEDERTWNLTKKRKRKDGVAPVKFCESCGNINRASAKECDSCGAPFKIKEKKIKSAEFVELKKRRGFQTVNKYAKLF